MYVTISPNNPDNGTSCRNLINYMEKEESLSREFTDYLDKESSLCGEEYFFDGENNKIEKEAVQSGIDNNCKRLTRDEARFYSLTFNPSTKEIKHLEKIAEQKAIQVQAAQISMNLKPSDERQIQDSIMKDLLREYTRECMDNYAKNFGREGIESNKDLVWFGRVEAQRYYKRDDKYVKHNSRIASELKQAVRSEDLKTAEQLKKQFVREKDVRPGGKDEIISAWMPKSGDNYHIHVVVSRNNKGQNMRLSPLAKARSNDKHIIGGKACKIGFNRDNYTKSIEKSFDEKFVYGRSYLDRYEMHKLAKQTPELYKEKVQEHYATLKLSRKINRIQSPEQIKDITIRKKALNKIANEAGMKYINQSIKPHKDIAKTVFGGFKIYKSSAKAKESAAMLSKQVGKNFVKLSSLNITNANPYMLALNITKIGIDRMSSSQNGHGYD